MKSDSSKFRLRKLLTVLLVTAAGIAGSGVSAAYGFAVFDGIGGYKPKPNLVRDFGFRRIHIIYGGQLWGAVPRDEHGPKYPDDTTSDDEARARKLARQIEATDHGAVVCLDIEHWHVHKGLAEAQASQEKLIRVVRWFHEEAPSLRVGYYGLLPIINYRLSESTAKPSEFLKWSQQSAQLTALANEVDIVFPCLYTLYDDLPNWKRWAAATMRQARTYGKPVYVFLWPEFHTGRSLGGHFIPRGFWREELNFVRSHADAIVLWGAVREGRGGDRWNNNWEWWQETKRFMGR